MTLTPNRAQLQAHALTELAANLRARIRPTVVTIHERLDELDGWATAPEPEAGRVSGGGPTESPTERTATQRVNGGHTRNLDQLDTAVKKAAAAIHHALTICDRYAPPVDKDRMRCAGDTGEPHSDRWARPECTNVADPKSRQGLCTGCQKRRREAERELVA